MVSTRGVKFNFSEGEKVLCYEPDPNKAKVLYDSKILECCVKNSPRGKKSIEYLVHFYGWNSSWDRFVAEHNILRSNEENRHLQRQLAEQAAESLKGKKLKLNKIPAIIKEVVVGNCSANNSSSDGDCEYGKELSEDNEEEANEETETCDDDSMFNTTVSGYASDNVLSEQSQSNDCGYQATFLIQIPDDLRSILEQDHDNVDVSKCVYNVPSEVNVKSILDSYVKKVGEKAPGELGSSAEDVQRVVLLKEFVNSIEIYFNTLLKDYLLYNEEERDQLQELLLTHQEAPFSQIYGLIHLLRMMTILPEFMSATSMPKKQLKILKSLSEHFLSYLSENKELFIC